MFDDGLASFLTTFPLLTAIQSDRVYPGKLPNTLTLPAMVYKNVTNVPNYSHDGDSGLDEMVYQLDCWANGPREAKLLAEALRVGLRVKTNRWSAAFIENKMSREDEETGLSRETLMVRFWYNP